MKPPIISTYNIYGTVSAIRGDDPSAYIWLYNNFIQIRYVHDWDYFVFDNHNLLFDNCPYIQHYIISQELLRQSWKGSIKDFITQNLENECYIYMCINRAKMSAYSEVENYYHEILVFGYDEDTVYFADNVPDSMRMNINDFFTGGKYGQASCSFSELEESYWDMKNVGAYFTNIHLLGKRLEEHYKLDLEQIIIQLKAYLYSFRTVDMFTTETLEFGMNAIYYKLNLAKDNKVDNKELFDIRAFHLFKQHKSLMKERLKYLIEHHYLENGEEFLDAYIVLEKNYERLLSAYIKFIISVKEDLFIRILKKLNEYLIYEQEVLVKLITQLEVA